MIRMNKKQILCDTRTSALHCPCCFVGDALSHHKGFKFSTFDKDHDWYDENCAKEFAGAFWYTICYHANLNGVYTWGEELQIGVNWRPWKGEKSVKSTSMMIRPASLA